MKLTLEETFIRLSEFEIKELTQTCNELQIKYKNEMTDLLQIKKLPELCYLFNGDILDVKKTLDSYNITVDSHILLIENKFQKKKSISTTIFNNFDTIIDNLYELSNTPLPPLPPIPPPAYENQLEQLRNMGFHDTIRNLDVLQLVGGDIEMALVYLTDS